MSDAAAAAGVSERAFEELLARVAADPERAFEDLRQLLYDATAALHACPGGDEGLAALAAFDAHPFAALLHRYELANWVLYARAYAPRDRSPDERTRAVDRTLRAETDALAWLTRTWVNPRAGT
jgi:hypothetical protein